MHRQGETNGNNVRVFYPDGKEFKMTGEKLVNYSERPKTEIGPNGSIQWRFNLDEFFPRLNHPGAAEVKFWYFSDADSTYDRSTWNGRVEMQPIVIER